MSCNLVKSTKVDFGEIVFKGFGNFKLSNYFPFVRIFVGVM